MNKVIKIKGHNSLIFTFMNWKASNFARSQGDRLMVFLGIDG